MFEPVNQSNSSEWFYDAYSENAGLLVHIKEKVVDLQTKLQRVQILITEEFGKILVLNRYIYNAEQSTELAEMITHVPLFSGPDKKKVLLIGGGDGISLSNILKHNVEAVDVVEIDQELASICQKHFCVDSQVWHDKRVRYFYEDGFEFLKKSKDKYDAIICPLSEIYQDDGSPGMAFRLYTEEFHKMAHEHLSDDGVYVFEGASMHYTPQGSEWWEFGKIAKSVFSILKPYRLNAKRIPGGEFVLFFCSKQIDPITDLRNTSLKIDTTYYNFETHIASFSLPKYARDKWKI